ncbi:MAG: crossover junction endodeoxyribonuclease RuvC [Proteobacteria bacterium]|nr:crossover junction endodeoxyribonuclease RuvC [Pseudomonadota bacterium]
MRVLGLDPGLRRTGWGVVDADGGRLRFVAAGTVTADPRDELARRLADLHTALLVIVDRFCPAEAAVEETFVNSNAASTLKLGQARGAALLAAGLRGIPVAEYAPNLVKKSVTGSGHAGKEQVQAMVGVLLPGAQDLGLDAADALAVAICHCHLRETADRWRAAAVAAAETG